MPTRELPKAYEVPPRILQRYTLGCGVRRGLEVQQWARDVLLFRIGEPRLANTIVST